MLELAKIKVTSLDRLVEKVLNNPDGLKLLEALEKTLFRETPRNINNTNDAINNLFSFISLLTDVTVKKAISAPTIKYNPDVNFIEPATALVDLVDDDTDNVSPMEDIALSIELLDDVDDTLPVPGILY